MKRKFTQRIIMDCTADQYSLIRNGMMELGYDNSERVSYPDIKRVSIYDGRVSFHLHVGLSAHYYLNIGPFNAELFLALSAMSDSEIGGIGEYWICTEGYKEEFTTGKLYKQVSDNITHSKSFIDDLNVLNGFVTKEGSDDNLKRFRKATAGELIAYFTAKAAPTAPEGRVIAEGGPNRVGWSETHDGTQKAILALYGYPVMTDHYLNGIKKRLSINFGENVTVKQFFEFDPDDIGKAISTGDQPAETSFFDQNPQPLPNYSEEFSMPTRDEWEKSRIKMLWQSIWSYVENNKIIPNEWVRELEELLYKRAEDVPF